MALVSSWRCVRLGYKGYKKKAFTEGFTEGFSQEVCCISLGYEAVC